MARPAKGSPRMLQKLAATIQSEREALVEQYDVRLARRPGYDRLPGSARRDLEQQLLNNIADALTKGDWCDLVEYVQQRALQWAAAGLEIAWFQEALIVPEEILVPLIDSVAASTFLWQALNRSQSAVWQIVADQARDNAEKLRAIYEGTGDAVMLLNEQGFFDCNPRTLNMFGVATKEDFAAVHPADVSPPFQPDGQESLPAAQAHIQTAYRQGYDRFEWVHRRTTGEDFPAEVLLSAFDFGGQRVLQATVRDITERKQAEAALSRERNLLRTLIDNLPDQIFFKDVAGRIILYNQADARAMGITSTEEALGKTVYDLYPPELADRFQADDMAVIQSGQPLYNREEPGIDEAGQPRWVLTTKVPLMDAQGNRLGLVGVARDITQRRKLEQSIRDSFERRGRQVEVTRQVSQEIATAANIDKIFPLVVTLIKERFNYYHAQIFRYDPAHDAVVLVAGYGEAGQQMLAVGHQLPMGRGIVGAAAETAQSILIADVTQDPDWQPNPYLPKTKGELAVPIKLRDQVLGILDVQADRAGALTDDDRLLVESLCGQIAIAIEFKQTEAALAREHYLMDALMANATDTLYFKDSQSRFLRISQSQAGHFGIADPAEAVGKSDFDFFTDEHARPAFEDEQQIIRTGQPIAREERETYADRPDTWVLTTKLPLRDEAGNIVGTFGISKDITERKLAEEAIRRSQAELSQALQIARLAYWEYDVAKDLFLFNDQFYAIFHTTAEQQGGYQLSAAQYAQRFVYPDDLPVVGAEIEKALNSTDRHYSRQLDHRILYADGGVGYISVSINIDRDEQGHILRYYGANQDITDSKLAEQELSEERTRLRTLIDNLPVSVFIKDRDSRFVVNNAVHLRILGAESQAAVLGKWDFDFFPQELAAQYYADEQELMRIGEPLINREEFVIEQATGKRQWALSTKVPLRDIDGEVTGFLGFTQDITERKEAEVALKETEERFRIIAETTPIPILISAVADGTVLYGNDQLGHMFGIPITDLIGMPTPDFYFDPADRQILLTQLRQAGSLRDYELHVKRADGTSFWVLVSMRTLVFAGQSALFAGFLDITARRQAAEELRRNQAELSQALQIAKLAYWEYDVERDLFLFNDQFYSIFHTTAKQHGGYQLSSAYYAQHFVHPNDLALVGTEIEKALSSTEQHYHKLLEHRILYADGGVGYITVNINIDRDEQGKILRYYGANQDITERKQTEEVVRASEAQLSEALKTARLAYWELDIARQVFIFNDQLYALLHTTVDAEGGYEMDINTYVGRYVYPEDIPYVGSTIAQGLQNPDPTTPTQLEARIVCADGEVRWLATRVSTKVNEAGQAIKAVGTNQDITERKLAEEAVRRSEAELSEALKIAKLAYWEYDVENDRFLFNDQFFSIFHTTAEQHGGYQLSSAYYAQHFVYPDDLPIVGAEIEKALTSTDRHYSRQIDHRILYADGGVGYISVSINIDRDEQGHILRYYGANQDITEAKLAEEAVRRSEAELAEALKIAKLAYWEYDVEKDLFLFNDQFFSIFHATAEQHGGYQLPSAYYAQHFVYPDDLPIVGAEIEKALNSTDQHYSRSLEHRILYADGGIGYISVSINIDRDERGKILRYYGANQDITDRKQAEVELTKFKLGLERSSTAIFITDPSGKIAYINPAFEQVYGYTRDEAIGQTPRIIKSGLIPLEQYKQFWGTLLSKHVVEGEIINKARDGRLVPIDGSNNPITDEAGNLLGFMGMHTDITQRKQAEAEREQLLTYQQERAAQLQAAAEVGRVATSILNPDQMLAEIVKLVATRFGFYHVAVFTVDDSGRWALLRDATGEVGQQLKDRGQALAIRGQAIVGRAIRQRHSQIALDVGANAIQFNDPLLPDTRSEIALPLFVGDQVLGAIDLHSTMPAAFDDNYAILLQSMADQIAVALNTAEQYQREQAHVEQTSRLVQIVIDLSEQTDRGGLETRLVQSALSLLNADRAQIWLRAVSGLELKAAQSIRPGADQKLAISQELADRVCGTGLLLRLDNPPLQAGYASRITDVPFNAALITPISWQGQAIGALSVMRSQPGRPFTQDDETAAQLLAAQAATALENITLAEQQQHRAVQLQTAAEVSQATSSILNLDELLPRAAEVVRARFNLYYVGIFLDDEAGRWAVLRAGTGDAGQQMLANGHRLKIGETSMISQCIVNRQARIALDVGAEAVRFDNPRLPLTRSELALPLASRGQVIGAVTIQSDQPAAFTPDDITGLQTMVDQIGNAIENARLYEQSSAALSEIDALNRRLTGEGWETYLRRGSSQQVLWASDDETIAPAALQAADEQLSNGQIVVEPAKGDEQQATLSVPVMLRGQTIGALRVAVSEADYTDELRVTLESLAGHVAQAAENARLLDESQARFARERALGEATDKIRRSSEVEDILQAAAEELAHYLQVPTIGVRLGSRGRAAGTSGQSGQD